MSDSPAPALPDDILTMLRSDAPAVANAAALAPAVSVPPGVSFPMSPVIAAEAPPAADPVVAAVVVAPEPAPAPVAPVARIVSDKPRSRPYQLMWPVEFAGKLYTQVVRSRPSAKDVGDYFERLLAAKDTDPDLRFPIFFDDAGAQVPEPVWDAMDDDDKTALLTELDDFLPLRLQRLRPSSPAASTPADGADTAPTA